jgi:hypothetical protein
VNESQLPELDLCPKIDPTHISSNSIKTTKLLGLKIRLQNAAETRISTSKATQESTAIETEQHDLLLPQRYFIEHLVGVNKNPPQKHNREL